MVGAKYVGNAHGLADSVQVRASNATIAAKDIVNLESGQLEVASAGDEVIGIALEAGTSASDIAFWLAIPGLQFLMDNDNTGTTFAVTHEGARFDITGTTGAQVVDTSTVDNTAGGRSGQLHCETFNPQGYGFNDDTSIGLFSFAERQL